MEKLKKYIKFILLKAVNLHCNDNIVVWCSKQQEYFASLASEYADTLGVCNTEIFYTDISEDLKIPKEKIRFWKQNGYKLLWVYSDTCTAFPPLSWTTVNVATESWAKQIFPDIADAKTATEKLWDAIFTACRINENCPVENWNEHISRLTDKAEKLNSYNFRQLHLKNSIGTDLTVNLMKNHKWINCTAQNIQGETVITNIPTEEVFTVPDSGSINGIVYATKPLLYRNSLIDKFFLRFENGCVTEYGAYKNEQLLGELLNSCKNANKIGEIAIVPQSSPIAQMGIFWYDTSFDENAGCHLALGSAYPQTLKNYDKNDSETLEKSGFNQSDIHEDFVIGSSDMEITATTFEGQTVTVMKNGEWNI